MYPPVLQHSYESWAELEAAISELPTGKDKGDALECFADFYFRYFAAKHQIAGDPYFPVAEGTASFAQELSDALDLPDPTDFGIDGAFVDTGGRITAVQCKFRSARGILDYQELSTFLAEAHKADFQLVFTNAEGISKHVSKFEKSLEVNVADLLALDQSFFFQLQEYANAGSAPAPPQKTPRPYQEDALAAIVEGFQGHDRGKLIAACGIGKTLISLWTAEELEAAKVLFVAPNLQLVRQTLSEWSIEASAPFDFLAVCSAEDTVDALDDEASQMAEFADVPTTTDPEVIATFLSQAKPNRRQVVFSTYQSLPQLSSAMLASGHTFDLAIFDEAHRTAGRNDATGFAIGLKDELIASNRRLFMTATERLFAPRAIDKAEQSGVELFSMDQEDLYGPIFFSLSFREAIDQGIICPYEIIILELSDKELSDALGDSDFIQTSSGEEIDSTALMGSIAIGKAIDEIGVRKMVSYHSTVRNARLLTEDPLLGLTSDRISGSAFHVNGGMSAGKRSQTIDSFESSEFGLLTNARCLVEGVDIPLIDGVCFVTPRTSMIDIVQAVGRALRKPWGSGEEKVARIVIPAVVQSGQDPNVVVESDQFRSVFNLVQALRDQDESLQQVIDAMNLNISKGKSPREGIGAGISNTITIHAASELDVSALQEAVEVRIARVNAKPGEKLEVLAEPIDRSSVGRHIKTLADYTPQPLWNNLIKPTLDKFESADQARSPSQLRVSNNNVSHARRLGVIREIEDQYGLTEVGKLLKSETVSFDDLLRNQLLIYEDPNQDGLFPYRLVAEFVRLMSSLRYWDFLFGIYSSDPQVPQDEMLMAAQERVGQISDYFPALQDANEASKEQLLDEMNAKTGLELTSSDVWTDRTTAANMFRYFGSHLEMFDSVFSMTDGTGFFTRRLELSGENASQKLDQIFQASSPSLSLAYGSHLWIKDDLNDPK